MGMLRGLVKTAIVGYVASVLLSKKKHEEGSTGESPKEEGSSSSSEGTDQF